MALLDKVIKNYNALSKIPSLLGAELIFKKTVLSSVWSQRDIEKGKTTKILRLHTYEPKQSVSSIDITGQLLSCLSKSEKLIGLIRENDSKQFLEIWTQDELKTTVNLKALDVHGDVYTDGEFASLQFSPDETKLLYIAEKKQVKTEPFWKRKPVKADDKPDEITKGQEYLYREDWGEQLVNKIQSVVVQYDLIKDEVEVLSGIPENICPAKPSYSPDGSHIIGIAYKTDPRKLGLIYCSNRLSTIFKLDFEGNYTEINLINKSVKDPRFTPNGNTLIWLQRNAGGPHAACMSLVKTRAPLSEESKVDVVIDIVQREITTANSKPFYGLYNNGFPKNCWTNDGRLLLATNQKNTIQSYIIDLDQKTITQLRDTADSFIILGVYNDTILANHRNFLKADVLVVAELQDDVDSIEWLEVTPRNRTPGLENHVYHYLDITQDVNDDVKTFSAIYVGPETGAEASIPLIVWPHGGPHSAFANNLSLEMSLFLQLGYAVLLINFRGSIGAGQASVDFLPGRVGTSDVSDCVLAVETALSKYPWLNRNAIALVGGSHGGFLVTHLSGQKPDMFKVVVARNAVIDIASMSVLSDIPDWCYVEAGSEYTQIGEPNLKILEEMRTRSPIQHAHKVKAPTMLQVGSKDLRVPQHQSKEYYTRLKANGITVKMHLYDDNHPLGNVSNEFYFGTKGAINPIGTFLNRAMFYLKTICFKNALDDMENTEQNLDNKKRITVEELNIEILPVVYEIIRSVEKDHHDNTSKSRESQDCSLKVLELQKRLDHARAQIRLLAGIEFSKEQQLNHLEALKTQLRLKQELLQKLIIRYLTNHPELVERSKLLAEERGLKENLSPEKLKQFSRRFSNNLKEELEKARQEYLRKGKP
ncbi:hypothetical protein Trydic_g13066 [Trypoxylus dichotomus]